MYNINYSIQFFFVDGLVRRFMSAEKKGDFEKDQINKIKWIIKTRIVAYIVSSFDKK